MRNCWRGVHILYGLYLLCHANGQMNVCLITSSVKLINKRFAAVYQFKSVRVVSCWDCVFLGCDLPILLLLKLLSCEFNNRLKDHFIMYRFTSRTIKYVTFHAWMYRLTHCSICNLACCKSQNGNGNGMKQNEMKQIKYVHTVS